MSHGLYEQKRLACYSCRDKKLRCTTVQGDICDRCLRRALTCRRPVSKRNAAADAASLPARRQLNSRSPRRPTDHSAASPTVAWHQALPNSHDSSQPDPAGRTDPPSSSLISRSPARTPQAVRANAGHHRPPDSLLPLESAERLFWSILEQQRASNASFTFANHLDTDATLDPVKLQIVSTRQALHLFDRFMDTFGGTLAYFDPRICTFDYILSKSQSLLSVICFIMARVEPQYGSIARQLDHHVNQTVYPAILTYGFRSVEIVQALLLLAAFESPSEDVREDRSWSLLSHAARVASEINLQACMSSRCDSHASQAMQLELRRAQRTWLNLWLHEFSLAQHTGRKSILAEQDLLSSCREWHLDPLAHYTDVALVSMVELRTIIRRNRHMFSLLPPGNELFYVEQCKSQIQAWSQTWASALSSSASIPRLELSRLYVSHALVQLLGLVLHHQSRSQWTPGIVMDLYEACSTYLEVFPQRLPAERLVYCYNSMWVAASYQVIVAVRLAELSNTFTFIDGAHLLQQCYRIYACISAATRLSVVESTAAHCYMRFLGGILRSSSLDAAAVDTLDPASASVPGSPDSIAETLVQMAQGQQPSLSSPSEGIMSFDLAPLLGFDDLEFFAWAGASLAQNDGFVT